jgi:hypothetical protein
MLCPVVQPAPPKGWRLSSFLHGTARERKASNILMTTLVSLILAAALVACGTRTGTGATGASGLEGVVLLGPMCPVEVASSPCPDRPVEAEVRAMDARSGALVGRTRSGADGRFRLSLRPGSYTVMAVRSPLGGLSSGESVTVTVRSGSYSRVTLLLDSGIR